MSNAHGHAARIFAVVLAAGAAERFGTTKQLAMLDGEPMVRRAARLARGCAAERTVLLTGCDTADVAAAAAGECHFLLVNERYRDGIGSSIALAARALAHAADALLLILADQPLVGADHLRALVDAWSGRGHHVIMTRYAGTGGPPVLMPRASFTALAALDGDRGARQVARSGAFELTEVACEAAAVDVDTPDDLARIAQGER